MQVKILVAAGDRFGRYTVISSEGRRNQRRMFRVLCDCGNERVVSLGNLRSSHTRSCGCYNREMASARKRIHGLSKTRIYEIWSGMKKRCVNKNSHAYSHYGGRGISICDEWARFESFLDWAASSGYSETLTLERIDNNGNYSPSNCKWIPLKRQNSNKRSSKMLTMDGRTMCVKDWADALGVVPSTLYSRISKGMSLAEAVKDHRVYIGGKALTLRQWSIEYGLKQSTVMHRINNMGWSIEKALSTPASSNGNRS